MPRLRPWWRGWVSPPRLPGGDGLWPSPALGERSGRSQTVSGGPLPDPGGTPLDPAGDPILDLHPLTGHPRSQASGIRPLGRRGRRTTPQEGDTNLMVRAG